MVKKAFIGLKKTRLAYDVLGGAAPEPGLVKTTEKVTILHEGRLDAASAPRFNIGDTVKTGQKIALFEDCGTACDCGCKSYAISPVTGTISSLTPFTGDFGKDFIAITIQAGAKDEFDDEFAVMVKDSLRTSLSNVRDYLGCVPGNPCTCMFTETSNGIETVVVLGVDADLLTTTNQFVVKSEPEALEQGISALKKITGAAKVVLAVPESMASFAGSFGATVIPVAEEYPSALPHVLIKDAFEKVIPEGKCAGDLGFAFISAEGAANIGKALSTGKVPVDKLFTLVKKDGSHTVVKARVGTPVKDVLAAFDMTVKNEDRIVFGGPMTGSAAYSTDQPIGPDTDTIMVQDAADVPLVSDYPCINCGECVRICPAKIPVNMLVRFLEAGQYEDAADQYDLYCCIECGLCSYVCVSRMPIFQYIRLAKHELARLNTAEAVNG